VILLFSTSQVKCLLIFFNTHGDVFGSGSAKHLHNQEANDTAIFFKNQMGNNLDAYRAAIGLFHACKMSLNIGYDSCKKHELENDIDEKIWVEVHAKGHSFLLCNTYRHEWTDSEHWACLNHAIGLAYQVNENIVIPGGLNSDLVSLNNNKLIDTMRLFNLKYVVEKPTRVTNHSRTLLDPIIVSDTINYVNSDVFKLPDNIGDHDASFVIIQCSKNISRSFKREIWQYQKMNYEKFEEKFNEINWNEKLDHLNDVDEMCEKFTKCFLKIAKECIPTKIVTIRNNDRRTCLFQTLSL
jgi:hypothetical protein